MRKITVLILLSAFLLNVLGFFKAYSLLNSKVRGTAKVAHYQRLQSEKEIVVILTKNHHTLTALGFKRVTNSEYLYHGDHYDVVKRVTTISGEKVHLKRDSVEDEILSFLHTLFGQTNSSRHAQNPIKKIYKNNITKLFLNSAFGTNNDNRVTGYIEFTPIHIPEPPFRSVHLPPPQLG